MFDKYLNICVKFTPTHSISIRPTGYFPSEIYYSVKGKFTCFCKAKFNLIFQTEGDNSPFSKLLQSFFLSSK